MGLQCELMWRTLSEDTQMEWKRLGEDVERAYFGKSNGQAMAESKFKAPLLNWEYCSDMNDL